MEEIKLIIISNENNNDNNEDSNSIIESKIKSENECENLNSSEVKMMEYREWLKDLIKLMNSCSYRKVLGEIEKNKIIYDEYLDNIELFSYKIIKLNAILRIIKIKHEKYNSEIKRENSHQNKSIKFWFNQAFYIFEELINTFDPEKNNKIDLDSLDIINNIKKIIEKYLEFFYFIILFYNETKEIIQICKYFSFVDMLIPYISYITDFKSIFIFQKILLFRAKISLQNRNYIISLDYQKHVIKLCYRILFFITDVYKSLENFDEILYSYILRKKYANKIYDIYVNLLLAFYLRGVTCEHLGDITRATKAYSFCIWIYLKFLLDDNELLGIFLGKIENISICRVKIINDIKKIIEKKKKFQNFVPKVRAIKKMDKYKRLSINNYSSLISKKENKINHYIKGKAKVISNRNRNTEKYKSEQLENYLNKIGKIMYKEEENRNNNLLQKFTKSKYILSTMTMINNFLSKDFRNILKNMNKIEITKPKDDIKELINKTILKKRRRLFNSHLKKIRRINSAFNINKRINEKDNISLKSSLIKEEINNNIRNKFKKYKNKRKINFNMNTSSINMNNRNTTNSTSLKIYKNKLSSIKFSQRNIKKNYSLNEMNNKGLSLSQSKIKKEKNIYTKEKVINYHVDKYEFSKSYLKKKNYIDKYFDKEIDFHKKLLDSKKYEINKSSDIEIFNLKKARFQAERDLDIMLNIEKSKCDKRNMSKYLNIKNFGIFKGKDKNKIKKEEENEIISNIKIEKEKMKAKKFRQRRMGIIEINQKKLIWLNNEGKMKKLNADCDEISNRQKKLKAQRRNILLKIGNRK